MIQLKNPKLIVVLAVLTLAAAGLAACSRSKGQPNNATASASPSAVVDVTTVAAVSRQLPRFFEATGSLAADVQTDVQPQTAGKVVAVGVDMGSRSEERRVGKECRVGGGWGAVDEGCEALSGRSHG